MEKLRRVLSQESVCFCAQMLDFKSWGTLAEISGAGKTISNERAIVLVAASVR